MKCYKRLRNEEPAQVIPAEKSAGKIKEQVSKTKPGKREGKGEIKSKNEAGVAVETQRKAKVREKTKAKRKTKF